MIKGKDEHLNYHILTFKQQETDELAKAEIGPIYQRDLNAVLSSWSQKRSKRKVEEKQNKRDDDDRTIAVSRAESPEAAAQGVWAARCFEVPPMLASVQACRTSFGCSVELHH